MEANKQKQPITLKFNVGDKVRILRDGTYGFKEGVIVTVTELYPDDAMPHYKCELNGTYWWVDPSDIEDAKTPNAQEIRIKELTLLQEDFKRLKHEVSTAQYGEGISFNLSNSVYPLVAEIGKRIDKMLNREQAVQECDASKA